MSSVRFNARFDTSRRGPPHQFEDPRVVAEGARGSVVGWGTMLQTGKSPVQVPEKVDFFNPSNRTMALGSTQPLTEMSTRNLPGG
jgi:hypothetical protein